MNVLFLSHIDETYSPKFPRNFRKNIAKVMETNSIRGIKFDRIIVLDSKVEFNEGIVREAVPHVKEKIIWGFRYSPNDPRYAKHIIRVGGSWQEYTWIPPFFRKKKTLQELKSARIYVGGGCNEDCVEVFIRLLKHLGLRGQRLRSVIFD